MTNPRPRPPQPPHPARLATVGVVLAATLAVGLTGCTPAAEPAPSSPPAPPASQSPSAAGSPSGDFQTGPPNPGQATTAPPKPTPSPLVSQSAPVQPGRGGIPRGQSVADAQLVFSDPDTVAAVFTARLLEVDTGFDHRPSDANPRAARLAGPELAKTLAERPQGQVPGWFSDLKQRGGWTAVTTTLGGLGEQPPDTPAEAYRAVTTRMTPLATGWQGQPQTTTWVITLTKISTTRTGAEWRVSAFQVLA